MKPSPLPLPSQPIPFLSSPPFAPTLTPYLPAKPLICLGLEGSANKLGAGLVLHHPNGQTTVLSNVRHTYITPPGEGFLPTDTAKHHRQWAVSVVRDAMVGAGVGWKDVDVIAYTKGWPSPLFFSLLFPRLTLAFCLLWLGPGMGGPLQVFSLVARTLSLMHNIPLIGVNHCVARPSPLPPFPPPFSALILLSV